ncbi:DUF6153 family protein [Streptomyces sp. CSDS2]|uniref:DUF6153 family protein n=1 Tax=Streptomyces sp. CSDS2 TaxID=3055051 RepID=UPI0025B1723F|nr:DUF6153 family protein [Streptomyces sp. CSDS2]MDN3259251.1 DUF6153 family protein [Streptomyces sp. CSDS2]
MRTTGQHPRRPLGRYRALSVLAVLIGLLGMHALAPGGGAGHTEHAGHAHATHMTAALVAVDDCGGHSGGHRLHHADPSCASGALTGGPHLAAPAPDPVPGPAPAHRPLTAWTTAPDGARAPPDLAELQLLRI